MKKNQFLMILFLLWGMILTAQTDQTNYEMKTLFSGKHKSNGFYVGLGGGYNPVMNKDGMSSSFKAAWIINHQFSLGINAVGFTNDFYWDHPVNTEFVCHSGGFGGLLFEPIIGSRFPIHLSFPITLGAGWIAKLDGRNFGNWETEYFYNDSDVFLIAEPGVELELNVLKFFRLGLGATYRITSSVQLENIQKKPLEGVTAHVMLKFGKF